MQPNSEPNVIPFIDILLVLLIIFMVAAPLPTVDIKVDLPTKSSQSVAEEGRRRTMVDIRDAGGVMIIYVDGQIADLGQIGDAVLKRAVVNNPALDFTAIYAEARIVVKADQNTEYGNVVRVMGRLQEEGFVKVGLLAEEATQS